MSSFISCDRSSFKASLVLALGLLLPFASSGQISLEKEADRLLKSEAPVAQRLEEFYKISWDYAVQESPETATQMGIYERNSEWSDASMGAIERRKASARASLRFLTSIDPTSLNESQRLNYDLFRRGIEDSVSEQKFPEELLAINQLSGVQQSVPQLLRLMPARTEQDFADQINRLRGVGKLVDQHIDLLRAGLRRKITPPGITLRDVPQQVANLMTKDPWLSPCLLTFTEKPSTISDDAWKAIRSAALVAYEEQVKPAYQRLHSFLEKEYLPGARKEIAFRSAPDGENWYRFRVAEITTTRMEPDAIHALGLKEVARIRGEMESIIKETRFEGQFSAFCEHLRTDPRFFHSSPEALIQEYRDISKRADAGLVSLFGVLPRLPYGVIPIPSYAEKSQTTAYYQPGSIEARRPGYFYANTYDLKSRPRWEMEALTLHEAVPGHHLQIALAQELTDVPEFRKFGRYTAFVEGWGLYSERLGYEMGFYQDPYARFGQLTYEMWRAIRLVVDTGMHWKGWSRDQAIEFFETNSSKAKHDIVVEIDRYIVWPGQALAYKVGELKIRELRAQAEKREGKNFDVRKFHDRLLGAGALPLDILEKRMNPDLK